MPLLAILVLAAQVGGPAQAGLTREGPGEPTPTPTPPPIGVPSPGLPFPLCSGIQVVAPNLKVQPRDLRFSSREVLDLQLRARLRRDLQGEMKKQGRPWCIGKAFDQSAPIGPVTPIATCGEITKGAISLTVSRAATAPEPTSKNAGE